MKTTIDPTSAAYADNRAQMLERVADLAEQHAKALAGGGEKYVARHHARGKLTARERIELLVDPDTPFLELGALAGWGTDFTVGGSIITGIGVVEGVECMIVANDPTVKGGSSNPVTVKKGFRAAQVAEENGLPTINLVESGGASLGGASMHAKTSGLADYLAADEHDAIRLGRQVVRRLNWRKKGPEPVADYADPVLDEEDLLGIVPTDLKIPFDPREVIARLVDGSEFDEFKPLYGSSLVTGYAQLHGYPIGILANAQGVLFSAEAQKAAQFIQLANQTDTPLLFLHNTTGYMVGAEYEQGGIIKHGAQMINAVSNSKVPHLSVVMGASYGAGHYGMSGRAYDPRFMFSWVGAKSAVMGPAQLAGVMEIVARQSAESKGQPFDAEGFQGVKDYVEQQIEEQSLAYFTSGMGYDDGVIDPRDTRAILGICLSAIHTAPVEGARGYGVFRL